jgi:ribosomal protein S18 acetylase RimI-like enzyme
LSVESRPGATKLRRARLPDWWRVYRAVRASFTGEFVDPFELLVALLFPWVTFLVAEAGGRIVGTTIVMPALFGPTTWISTVGVIPAYRRRGVARELLLAAERVSSHPCLRLEVYADNAGALALYSQLGYRQLRVNTGEGRPRVEMEKRMNA